MLELGGAAVAVLVVETAGVGVVVGGGVLVADAHAVVVEPVDDGARLQVELVGERFHLVDGGIGVVFEGLHELLLLVLAEDEAALGLLVVALDLCTVSFEHLMGRDKWLVKLNGIFISCSSIVLHLTSKWD